jgi:NAD(P)-dependent dehydrogenase (short-subunit alcohol dehydrogenase family)
MTLTNRVVVLVGARRMGMALAAACAERGADVALGFHASSDEAGAAASRVRERGRRAVVVHIDVTNPASCDAFIAEVERALGRIDAVVALASLYEHVPFERTDAAVFDRALSVDLRGTFLLARAAVPALKRAGGGHVVTSTDWVAASGRPRYRGYLAYYVAKAGVKALTEALAIELAADKILVNAIAPGPILAPEGTTLDKQHAIARATPLGHWAGQEEFAKAVVALLETDFITGQTVRVDGGRHLS